VCLVRLSAGHAVCPSTASAALIRLGSQVVAAMGAISFSSEVAAAETRLGGVNAPAPARRITIGRRVCLGISFDSTCERRAVNPEPSEYICPKWRWRRTRRGTSDSAIIEYLKRVAGQSAC